jgi:hypothetical protein
MSMSTPRNSIVYPDRDLDCQQALEETFHTLLDLAEKAGWTRTEAAEAMRELAFAHLAMEDANLKTDLAIAQAQADTSTKH